MNDFSSLASDVFACTDFGSDEPAFKVTEQDRGFYEIVKSEYSQGEWSGWDTQLGSEGKW
jgi:hypothetical protein